MIDFGEDAFAGQAFRVRSVEHREIQFGSQDDFIAVGEILQSLAYDLFAGSGRIQIRSIEEIDSGVQAFLMTSRLSASPIDHFRDRVPVLRSPCNPDTVLRLPYRYSLILHIP